MTKSQCTISYKSFHDDRDMFDIKRKKRMMLHEAIKVLRQKLNEGFILISRPKATWVWVETACEIWLRVDCVIGGENENR